MSWAKAARLAVTVFIIAAITVAAFVLRASLLHFPLDAHIDEPIVAILVLKNLATHEWSANWTRLEAPLAAWARVSYQFSPYTLLQTAIGWVAEKLGTPHTLNDEILIARWSSAVYSSIATVFLALALLAAGQTLLVAAIAQSLLAFSMLSVQDGIYARCDALISLLSMLGLWLTVRAVRRPTPSAIVLVGFLSGLLMATKYNAIVALIYITVAVAADQRSWIIVRQNLLRVGIAFTVAFILATPEMLSHPAPLFKGAFGEWKHYMHSHRPFEMYNWADNNVFYWTRYLGELAIGYPALLAIGYFLVRAVRQRSVFWWALLIGTVCVAATRVRFERNLESVLGLLCAGAVLGVVHLAARLATKIPTQVTIALAAAVLFALPGLATWRFWQLLDEPNPNQQAAEWLGTTHFIPMQVFDPPRLLDTSHPWIMVGFSDSFSKDGWKQWAAFPQNRFDEKHFISPWARYGYPFSTVEAYHGPIEAEALRPVAPSEKVSIRKPRSQE